MHRVTQKLHIVLNMVGVCLKHNTLAKQMYSISMQTELF